MTRQLLFAFVNLALSGIIFAQAPTPASSPTKPMDAPVSTSVSIASPTPATFSAQTLAELARLQRAALDSDYAYRQVAYLTNNIGPRLSGPVQAARAVEYA